MLLLLLLLLLLQASCAKKEVFRNSRLGKILPLRILRGHNV